MATEKRVQLTCKCGTPHTLNMIHDFPARCANERCRATLEMSDEGLWKYQESLIALMRTLGLRRDYLRELEFARKMSRKYAPHYTINVIEVQLEKPPDL